MLNAALALVIHSFHICLRLAGRVGGSFPRPLTAKEEEEALTAMRNGEAGAREKLILHNMRLVAHIIKKYYIGASDQEDLLSIGTVGLVKAIDSYKHDKNVKLPTYACKCIQNELFMHFRSQRKRLHDLSLSDPLDGEGEGNMLSVQDVLSIEDGTQERLELSETYAIVSCFVDEIQDARQKRIIKMRYGFDNNIPLTQREVAGELNISRSYVSRLEKKALTELQEKIVEKGI